MKLARQLFFRVEIGGQPKPVYIQVDSTKLDALISEVRELKSEVVDLRKEVKEFTENRYYYIPELAIYLRTTTQTIYNLINKGLLSKDKIGTNTIIHQRDLTQYLQSGKVLKRRKRKGKLDDESTLF